MDQVPQAILAGIAAPSPPPHLPPCLYRAEPEVVNHPRWGLFAAYEHGGAGEGCEIELHEGLAMVGVLGGRGRGRCELIFGLREIYNIYCKFNNSIKAWGLKGPKKWD